MGEFIWNALLLLAHMFVPNGWIYPWPDVSTVSTCGSFQFASYYANHMVLQRTPTHAKIWGYGYNILDEVTLSLSKDDLTETYITITHEGSAGKPIWELTLDPHQDGGPYNITATSGGCTINITDILFGDVWLCSGQSNMGFQLQQMHDAKTEIDNVTEFPNVRVFQNALNYADSPLEDLKSISLQWQIPTPDNIRKFSAVCWLYGRHLFEKYQRPIGLVQSDWGGTRVEAWSPPSAIDACFPDGPPSGSEQNEASVLFNAMIHPFLPMPIYGAIWYQGEANVYDFMHYGCSIKAMISDWRSLWHANSPTMDPSFPFGEVQLAPFDKNDTDRRYCGVRWGQSDEYGYAPNEQLQRVFMAIAIDTPDFNSPYAAVHVRYKRPAAWRLALAGFAVAYDDDSEGPWQGPIPTDFKINGSNLVITLSNGRVELEIRDTTNNTHYEVCCAANPNGTCNSYDVAGNDSGVRWIKTSFISAANGQVTVSIPCDMTKEKIKAIRYAWRMSPCLELNQCPIYGKVNNLPAPPYFYSGLIAS